MLRVNRTSKELMKLDKRSLPQSGLTETSDLQQMIRNSPDAFFAENGHLQTVTFLEGEAGDETEDEQDA